MNINNMNINKSINNINININNANNINNNINNIKEVVRANVPAPLSPRT